MNDSKSVSIPEIELWDFGAVRIPQAAQPFSNAATAVDGTAAYDGSAFTGNLPGSGLGKLRSEWTTLRNILQDDVLGTTYRNLNTAGKALVKYADDQVRTDDDNRRLLEAAKQSARTDPIETERPPAPKPDPPRSDDSDVPGNPRYAG